MMRDVRYPHTFIIFSEISFAGHFPEDFLSVRGMICPVLFELLRCTYGTDRVFVFL